MTYRDQKRKTESQQEFDQDYRRWKCDLCPICKKTREDQFHVVTCMSKRSKRCRKRTHTTLSEWFTHQHTDPIISQCILLVLSQNGDISFVDAMKRFTDDNMYLDTARSQDLIGFVDFQFGRISRSWKFLQERYLNETYNGRRYSYEVWTKRLVYQLYMILKVIWKRRCEIVHGSLGKEISKRERKAVRKEIRLQYTLGNVGVRAGNK